MTTSSPCTRVHIVLVPGFAGFDALGQLEYYAGVTPLLDDWRADRQGGPPVVLHYFDNLPTASVATRAGRLRAYLAKRVARGELQRGDTVALVGHSTGGLDIRQLLLDLDRDARTDGSRIAVDGNREDAFQVPPSELLEMVSRVVFLSVPQRGTNIADFVRRVPRTLALLQLRLLVTAARLWPANEAEQRGARWVGGWAHSDLLLAVGDAIGEMDAHAVRRDATRSADAHEAAAELELVLTHVASDFGAIEDLAAAPRASPSSPAHFTEAQREDERQMWRRHGIEARSYATVGCRAYDFRRGEVVPPWEALKPSTAPWERLAPGVAGRMDVPYLCGYRACAGGPFGRGIEGPLSAKALGTSDQRSIEIWDNDGVVNTASMLWPSGEDTQLVDGDHGDIIGHYRLVEAADGPPLRRYHTYDLLRSGSGFSEDTFEEVWRGVFTFCASPGLRSVIAAV